MLNTLAVALPSAAELADACVFDAVACAAWSPAGFGPGTVVRVRERKYGDGPAGTAGGSNVASGYLAGSAARDSLGQFRGIAMTGRKQNSTVQHNTIPTTLLNPVAPGGVGPLPVREPGPA